MPRKTYISGQAMLEMMGRTPKPGLSSTALRKRISRAADHYCFTRYKHPKDQSVVFDLQEVQEEQQRIIPVPKAA